MKKLLFALGFIFATSAQAQFVPVQTFCSHTPAQGYCQVYNHTFRPLLCQIRTTGLYRNGMTYTSFNNTVVYPGMYAYSYVYSNNYFNPLVRTYGHANCRF